MKKTLNGYDQDVAQQMIANFANNYTSDTSTKSILAWYSVDQLKNINDLLTEEMDTVGTDGVRLYFGCDAPEPGKTKLNLSIFMVSTKPQAPANANQSNHGSYYDHNAPYLNAGPFGATVNDNAALGLSQGALLYDELAPPADTCSDPGDHYIDSVTAYNWVRSRCELNGACDKSPLNTRSEWFDISFITSLFSSIIDNGLSGLRIYLGKGHVDKTGLVRDVTLLVPTRENDGGNHVDDYTCLDGILNSHFVSLPPALNNNSSVTSKASIADLDDVITTRFAGGYDNGELCPSNCD